MYKYYKFQNQHLKDCNWYPCTFIEYHKSDEMEYYSVFFQNTHLLKLDIQDNYKCSIFHSYELLEIQKSQKIKLEYCTVKYQDKEILVPIEYALYETRPTIANNIIGITTYNPTTGINYVSLEYMIKDIFYFHINSDIENINISVKKIQ